MKYSIIINALAALTCLVGGVLSISLGDGTGSGAAVALRQSKLNIKTLDTPEGKMNITALKWTGPSKGVNITLYGDTIDDIHQQLNALDPEHRIPDRHRLDGMSQSERMAEVAKLKAAKSKLSARYGPSDGYGALLCCPVNVFQPSNYWAIQTGFFDVSAAGGDIEAPPNTCINTWCDPGPGGAGIYLCNGDSVLYSIQAVIVGWMSWDIAECPNQETINGYEYACGQQFGTDYSGVPQGWNVVVTTC